MRRCPLALLALPVAWVACFSSSSSGPGGGADFDASEDTTFPEGSTGDAAEELPTIDAPVDSSPDVTSMSDASNPSDASESEAEAGGPLVSILVFGASGPEQGVTIVFADASGAVAGSPVTTGVQGLVNQALPAGATTMTALLGTATNPSPYTVMGVQPGDLIVVPDFASLAPYTSDSLAVTALPAPPANTASYYLSAGACASSGSTAPLTASLAGTACFGLGAFGGTYHGVVPVLVEAYDANANLLGFTFQKSNPVSGFDAGLLALSLAGDTWSTSTTTQSVVVTNEPDGESLTPFVAEAANGVLRQLQTQTVTDDAGVQQTVVTTHAGYADTLQTEAVIYTPQWAIGTAVGTTPPAANGTVTVDATSLGALPQITGVSVDSSVAAQPKLTWTLAQGSLGATTGLVAYASWAALDDAGTQINGNWTIVAPSSSAAIQAPALPAAASAYQPPTGATYQGTVQGLVGSMIPNYAQVRTVGAAIASPPTLGCVASPVIPAIGSGTLSVTIFTTALCG